ncbi:hypothetical protein AWV80_26090 [Cupriavidus sp. UYMU48A]|nr:hypothetical protein AWV80_26090 [Cupriavidus sp. UYMU48A]
MGQACIQAIGALGFKVSCWSRNAKGKFAPSTKAYAGEAELDEFLAGCNTLVCLLPLTAATAGFLSKRVFDALPQGAHVINAARGEHLVVGDLLEALDSDRLSRATLDVFDSEPLTQSSPLWHHRKVVLTPHIAARPTARATAEQLLSNLAAIEVGLTPTHAVDVLAGY